MMKKVLFVINTLGQAGAETALLELLRKMDSEQYEISLYVLMGQGEMVSMLPDYVKLKNSHFDNRSVLSAEGKGNLKKTVLKALLKRGNVIRKFPYLVRNLCYMIRKRKILIEKLLWDILSEGAERFDEHYDLAVAYLEGGSTYYVANWVNADKKAAFVHVDYEKAGYTRALDQDCYKHFDQIFTVSDEVKMAFEKAYPEYSKKTQVFHNILDCEGIRKRAEENEGFTDEFSGIRILSVGRLTTQKAFEVSIDAMKMLKDSGENVRWYVLGDGDQRKKLEDQVEKLGLQKDFLMPGAVKNPYPYMKQADIYVHASRFEGKSIAIQEAQIIGKPMVVSDCSGNREQVIQDVDGVLCDFTAEAIFQSVRELIHDEAKRKRLGEMAAKKNEDSSMEIQKLLALMEG